MSKLFATVTKEILLLWQDRAGLLVLFAMPAVLVLVVSLVQENVMKTMGETTTRALLVDEDGGDFGRQIEKRLFHFGSVELVREIGGRKVEVSTAKEAVRKGQFQFCLIIPAGSFQSLAARARHQVEQALAMATEQAPPKAPGLMLYFDPAVQGSFRSAVRNSLQGLIAALEMQEKNRQLADLLPQLFQPRIQKTMGAPAAAFPDGLAAVDQTWSEEPLLEIRETDFSLKTAKKPSSVQQNVPAWALFGMFFIVVPLAGGLIKERNDGVFQRLLSAPVSPLFLLAGKLVAYLLICYAQFGLIFLIGKYLLPLLGTPELVIGRHLAGILFLVFCTGLAATAYGTLLGTLARTFEQASMLGAISVVMAAALGGIMVPVYAMPENMQALSILSPLGWSHNAFLDLLVREGTFSAILPEASGLLGFAGGNMVLAWFAFRRKGRLLSA